MKFKVGDSVRVKRQGSECLFNAGCGRCMIGQILTIREIGTPCIWIYDRRLGGCSAFIAEDLELVDETGKTQIKQYGIVKFLEATTKT